MKKGLFLLLVILVLFLGCYGGSQLISAPDISGISSREDTPFLGRIYDVERRLLAESQKAHGILLLPQAFEARPENLDLLARLSGKDKTTLTLLLSGQKSPVFLKISNQQTPHHIVLPGVFSKEYYQRQYFYRDLFSPLLGQGDSPGALESFYEPLLSKEGSFLRTALKVEFQESLKRDLLKALKRLGASKGVAAIMDLQNGRIRALGARGGLGLFLAPQVALSWLKEPFEEGYYESMYDSWEDFLRDIGFGEPSGIDLPGDSPGLLPAEVWSPEEVRISLAQLLKALAALKTGRVFSPKIGLEAGDEKEKYLIAVESRELEDLIPRERGGIWWSGGSRKAGYFLMAGLWPRKNPRLAFAMLITGVRAYGLPCYYTRFIPRTVKLLAQKPLAPSPNKVKAEIFDRMPDVRGLTLKAALERLAPLGLEVRFSGFGVTVKQWPAPGTPLARISKCQLVLR